MNMAKTCIVCRNEIKEKDYWSCDFCGHFMHNQCKRPLQSFYRSGEKLVKLNMASAFCPDCLEKVKSSGGDKKFELDKCERCDEEFGRRLTKKGQEEFYFMCNNCNRTYHVTCLPYGNKCKCGGRVDYDKYSYKMEKNGFVKKNIRRYSEKDFKN